MCRNNLVRNGKSKQLEVFDAGKPGLGVRAKEEIEKGAFVVEYTGLCCIKDKDGNSEEGDDLSYTCRIDNCTVIDSKIYGNISRFVNHSCKPNCSLLPWTVDGRKRAILVSNQRINLDEEITQSILVILMVSLMTRKWELSGNTPPSLNISVKQRR